MNIALKSGCNQDSSDCRLYSDQSAEMCTCLWSTATSKDSTNSTL